MIGIAATKVNGELRSLLSHSMERSGIAIRNTVHKTSKAATLYLVGSMIDSNNEFNIKEHQSLAKTAECTGTPQKQLAREHDILTSGIIVVML